MLTLYNEVTERNTTLLPVLQEAYTAGDRDSEAEITFYCASDVALVNLAREKTRISYGLRQFRKVQQACSKIVEAQDQAHEAHRHFVHLQGVQEEQGHQQSHPLITH